MLGLGLGLGLTLNIPSPGVGGNMKAPENETNRELLVLNSIGGTMILAAQLVILTYYITRKYRSKN